MAASSLAELPGWAAGLLEEGRVARLGLLDEEGHPRVQPVVYALATGRVWSAVDQKPKKSRAREIARVRFLRRDPRAALTVDRYSDDWSQLAWVQLLGTVAVLDIAEAAAGIEALAAKYEQYRETPPQGPVLCLEPRRYLFWRSQGSA